MICRETTCVGKICGWNSACDKPGNRQREVKMTFFKLRNCLVLLLAPVQLWAAAPVCQMPLTERDMAEVLLMNSKMRERSRFGVMRTTERGHEYWILPAKNRDAQRKAVLFINGGPTYSITERPDFIPDNVDFISFDFAGIGGHFRYIRDPHSLTIEFQAQIAADVLQSIEKNYSKIAIYGVSYGTSVATVLAANPQLVGKVDAVVLAGSAGDSKESDSFALYNKIWNRLNRDERNRFRLVVKKVTEIYSRYLQGKRLSETLKRNRDLDIEHFFKMIEENMPWHGVLNIEEMVSWHVSFHLQMFGTNHSVEKIRGWSRDPMMLITDMAGFEPFLASRNVVVAECEFRTDRLMSTRGGFAFLPALRQPECPCPGSFAPFNPAKYQSALPLVYLQGTEDPITPHAEALNHFRNQKLAPKVFVEFPGYGHSLHRANNCQRRALQLILKGEWSKIASEKSQWKDGCQTSYPD